jgi:hypothetical protein
MRKNMLKAFIINIVALSSIAHILGTSFSYAEKYLSLDSVKLNT